MFLATVMGSVSTMETLTASCMESVAAYEKTTAGHSAVASAPSILLILGVYRWRGWGRRELVKRVD
jgi:hypothetical protein